MASRSVEDARLCGVSAVVTFGAGLIVFVRQDLNH